MMAPRTTSARAGGFHADRGDGLARRDDGRRDGDPRPAAAQRFDERARARLTTAMQIAQSGPSASSKTRPTWTRCRSRARARRRSATVLAGTRYLTGITRPSQRISEYSEPRVRRSRMRSTISGNESQFQGSSLNSGIDRFYCVSIRLGWVTSGARCAPTCACGGRGRGWPHPAGHSRDFPGCTDDGPAQSSRRLIRQLPRRVFADVIRSLRWTTDGR